MADFSAISIVANASSISEHWEGLLRLYPEIILEFWRLPKITGDRYRVSFCYEPQLAPDAATNTPATAKETNALGATTPCAKIKKEKKLPVRGKSESASPSKSKVVVKKEPTDVNKVIKKEKKGSDK